jgi:hypothetical protein
LTPLEPQLSFEQGPVKPCGKGSGIAVTMLARKAATMMMRRIVEKLMMY